MMQDERFAVYLGSLDQENPDYLERLETYAREMGVPVIRRQMQNLLKVLFALRVP